MNPEQNIGVIGVNHKTAPLGVRESLGFTSKEYARALDELKELFPGNEFVVLSTCNRVEIYTGSETGDIRCAEVADFLASCHDIKTDKVTPFIYTLRGDEAVSHLFEVASSLDSLVIGEAQILGQLKESYQVALNSCATSKILNNAFQRAFGVAKKVRTLTKIGEGNVSISSISCQLAEEILKGLSGKKVLLLGAGKAGTLAIRSLYDRGARSVLVSNRNYERARHLAEEFHGKAVRFEDLEGFLSQADIVISSTSAPHYMLTPDMLKRAVARRDNRPLFLIDLAVPRDIDPSVSEIENVYLYNVDSLKRIASENISQREDEITQCRKIVFEEVEKFLEYQKLDNFIRKNNDKLFETFKT